MNLENWLSQVILMLVYLHGQGVDLGLDQNNQQEQQDLEEKQIILYRILENMTMVHQIIG